MQFNSFFVRKAAVLGASLMGAQIAAHLVNAGIEVLLFDQPGKEGEPNGLIKQALSALQSMKPGALAVESWIQFIQPANYDHDLVLLRECDLIIEAIPERIDWKRDLFAKISPFLSDRVLLLSNTSGLCIEKLSLGVDESLRSRFCGIHFFNPPRFSSLVEIIPHSNTDPAMVEQLETFLVSRLGKCVVVAKDSPNFIGNRIISFSMISTLIQAEKFGIPPDMVDLLTGSLIGRPATATFRALDIIGLDVVVHMLRTMESELQSDPWHAHFKIPDWITSLVQKGMLGEKTKAGIYRRIKDELQVTDKLGNYRPVQQRLSPELVNILQIQDLRARFQRLRLSALPEARFLWAIFRDLFHYCAYHLSTIAETARDLDRVMRAGFGFQQGPFEIWQSIGWKTVIEWIEEDLQTKSTLAKVSLPGWVNELGESGVYRQHTAFSPKRGIFVGPSKLPVYHRQLYPDKFMFEREEERPIFETDAIKMWWANDGVVNGMVNGASNGASNGSSNGVAILSFKTGHNVITKEVLEGILESIKRAEFSARALLLWQRQGEDFSFGANLHSLLDAARKGQMQLIADSVKLFQKVCQALRYATIPTIAVTRGRVLGGGCELMMHCTATVAALESYPGLVEVGAGLIPAGGGSKEMARRASIDIFGIDPLQILNNHFDTIASSVVAKSAPDAKRLGFLNDKDLVVMNPAETLYVAKQLALCLSESNYSPPLKQKIKVAGKPGWAALQVRLMKNREASLISDHDYLVLSGLASVLCGGDVEGDVNVPEEWLLELERQFFLDLIKTDKTQERIAHLLEHGKILRN